MFVIGIDASINSSGIVKFELDGSMNIVSVDYLGFNSTKKETNGKIKYYRKDDFKNNLHQGEWMANEIAAFIPKGSHVGIEGNSMGSKNGMVFDIGGFIGVIKNRLLFSVGCKLKSYPPSTCKMFATGKGNADKVQMRNAYDKLSHPFKIDVSWLNKFTSPSADIVDAWFIAEMVVHELTRTQKILDLCAEKKNALSAKLFAEPFDEA